MPEKPSYRAAHNHLRAERGNATDHTCACGKPAEEWGFQHVSNAKLIDTEGKVYSDNPHDYSAMCRTCHQRFDRRVTPERFGQEVERQRESPETKEFVQGWTKHVKGDS